MSQQVGLPCNESLLEMLEDQGGFQVFLPRKRLEPGEGLTKIWMCPSSEMTTALFATKPVQITRENEGSLNIIDKVTGEKKQGKEGSGSESGSVAESDQYYNESSSEESLQSLIEIESDEEDSFSSVSSYPDERIDNVKQSLKKMYRQKLAQGADLILSHSRKLLDNQLYKIATEYREQEEEKINKALKTIVEFIDRHKMVVNRENGYILKKKYHIQRRECITRLIDAAEESFAYKCIQLEKQMQEVYLFNVEQLRNQFHIDHKERRRSELDKWVNKFKEERETIRKNHEKAVTDIKDKYQLMYDELQHKEQNRVQEEVDRIKDITVAIETITVPPVDLVKQCAEDTGWLCILNHLLTDMQQFMKSYITSEHDIKNLLRAIMRHTSFSQPSKSKANSLNTAPLSKETTVKLKEPSVDTIPCIKDRDEGLHRSLVQEAGAILEKILSDLSQGRINRSDLEIKYKLRLTRTSTVEYYLENQYNYLSDADCSRYNISLFNDSDKSTSSSSESK